MSVTPQRPRPRPVLRDLAENHVLVGSIILAVALVGVVLSYNANKGLPFVPAYEITVEVPDAAELVEAGSEVRIGGARVGIVKEMDAERGRGDAPAFARLRLAMEVDQKVPVDSRVRVRPRSVLGAKYVEITKGSSKRNVEAGGTLPLRQSRPIVELDEAFGVFDKRTREGIQRAVSALGDALAGRGQDINDIVVDVRALLPPLQRTLRIIAAPSTDLDGFVRGVITFTTALEPVADSLGRMIDASNTTLAAVDRAGPDLEGAIAELPGFETTATRALRTAEPVLADAAALAHALGPGTRALPRATERLGAALRDSQPALRRTPLLVNPLRQTLASLDRLARDKAADGAVRKLTDTVRSLKTSTDTLNPAQLQCNFLGLWGRNLQSTVSRGDGAGAWINAVVVLNTGQMFQVGQQAGDLHANPYPHMDATECEAGNEPFVPGRQIGNPAGTQSNSTEITAPPEGTPATALPSAPSRRATAPWLRLLRSALSERALGRCAGGLGAAAGGQLAALATCRPGGAR